MQQKKTILRYGNLAEKTQTNNMPKFFLNRNIYRKKKAGQIRTHDHCLPRGIRYLQSKGQETLKNLKLL